MGGAGNAKKGVFEHDVGVALKNYGFLNTGGIWLGFFLVFLFVRLFTETSIITERGGVLWQYCKMRVLWKYWKMRVQFLLLNPPR